MIDEQINQRIAEACGWKEISPWLNGDRCFERKDDSCGYRLEDLPNYCNDLNAMHEAEKILAPRSWNNHSENWWNYSRNLACISDGRAIHATARERAETFLRTLGKWDQSGERTEMVKEVQK